MLTLNYNDGVRVLACNFCASLEIRIWALWWFRLDISGGWIRLFWALAFEIV